MHILPADTYTVLNKTILNDQDRKLLIMLYQPIIGTTSINLYFTLWSYLDKTELFSEEWTHHHLMTSMRMKLSEIEEARKKLEAIGLLRSYLKKGNINQYIYELYSPVSAYEFFNNPVLSISLYNNIGVTEFEKLVEYFKMPRLNLKEYTDITSCFSDVFEATDMNHFESSIEDIRRMSTRKLELNAKIDIPTILSMIPEEMLNTKGITKDTKELLYRLSFIYNYNDDEMRELIRNSISDKKTIDKVLLKKNARKFYQFEHSGKLPSLLYRNQPEYLRKPLGDQSKRAKIIYQFETTTPYDFLLSKYNGSKPSKNDVLILEYLLVDMNLNPGVVNVLIDYILKINNNKLIKAFVETIASQWAKSKIETVEAAMIFAEKEYKNRRTFEPKMKQKKELNPSWFHQEIESSNASLEEQKEMEKLLSR